jgi:hypothetical protein
MRALSEAPRALGMTQRPYRRFLILSSPRCGTHMLRTSFSGHPNVVARTELFNPDWNRNEPFDDSMPAATVLAKHVFRPYPGRVGAVGFALHRSGARLGNWLDLWRLLEADTDLQVISLRRDDLLRRYVSFCLMRERNRSGEGEAFMPAPRAYRAADLQAEFERAERELAVLAPFFTKDPAQPMPHGAEGGRGCHRPPVDYRPRRLRVTCWSPARNASRSLAGMPCKARRTTRSITASSTACRRRPAGVRRTR